MRLGTFLEKFVVIFDHIWHLNFTDCFEGEGFVLDLNNGLQTLSKLFLFSLSLGTLPYTPTRITNASSKEEPRHFIIYHYITATKLW